MNKIEKINKLKDVLSQLKTEFVGLDEIIDEIGRSIFPWYVTPEVNNRPVVISLWGMTGTGKTSLVNRLLELLDLTSKTLNFDCGSESGDGGDRSISAKINDYLYDDDLEVSQDNFARDLIFIFDEFQHARTLTEDGSEQKNQSLQPVWTLIDSGRINLNEAGDWRTSTLINFIEDLRGFIEENPEHARIPLEGGYINDPADVRNFLEAVGMFHYDRGIPGIYPRKEKYYSSIVNSSRKKSGGDDEDDPYRPLCVLDDEVSRIVAKELRKNKGVSVREVFKVIHSSKNLGELLDLLDDVKKMALTPRILDCSSSLVFILGNLDEAFTVGKDTNPDIDADIFYEETKKVTIGDIKEALKNRFRPEQIARLGNTLIKYPTLKKAHFKEIIGREVSRVTAEFEKSFRIPVKVTEKFKALLYSEGVFPSQGVRPVFTTISSMFNPLLSEILVYTDGKSEVGVVVDVESENFKVPEIKVFLDFSDGGKVTKTTKLSLGADRDPRKRKTGFINGIHEAGHAILLSYCTGKLPLSIVAVSADHGGFCTTYDHERSGEIDSRQDVDNSVVISMGGWCAEEIIFESGRRLLGSGSDISDAWETLSEAYYKNGYFRNLEYASKYSHDSTGVPNGFSGGEVLEKQLERKFNDLTERTKVILRRNRKLLLVTGKELGETGEMSGERFMELIREHGGTLTEQRMKEAKEECDYGYYEKTILDELSMY